ncbi:MAG: 3-phosphoshikimate 1-carboxyvinyltransferase [Opitutales bacterium]
MTDPLPIPPFRKPLSGQRVTLPGSKSLTNRALILAALSDQTVTLEGALFSRDSRIMCDCLENLGFKVTLQPEAKRITIQGGAGNILANTAQLFLGNSGTSARFVTALAALRPGGVFSLDGDPPMRQRPMEGLLRALEAQGTRFTFQGKSWHMPFVMETDGLKGGSTPIDAQASSQLLSALLMVAPFAREPARIELLGETVSQPFVRMTCELMAQLGASNAEAASGSIFAPRLQDAYHFEANAYLVEPDATAASYFLALPLAAGGQLTVTPWPAHMLQGDAAYADLMAQQRLVELTRTSNTLQVSPGDQRAGFSADFNTISDTFLTLAALAPLLNGPTEIRGIGHTRHQETDRIHAMATELRKLGQTIEETDDSLKIVPDPAALKRVSAQAPLEIETYEDHRVAMSFGILGSHDLHGDGRPWLAIRDPACCGKTFPDFFEKLDALREGSDA